MLKAFSLAVLLLFASTAIAQDPPEMKIWPNGLPEGAAAVPPQQVARLQSQNSAERISYVKDPTITLYKAPAETANGCGIVICPGGGYNILAIGHEGVQLAEWFNSIGVTAVVLKYRVPRRDPEAIHREPLQDAQRAMRLTRAHAEEWGIDPARIGMMGFSAGGHLTFMTGMHFDEESYAKVDEADELSARPDFLCPIYAAYLGENYADNKAELGSLVNVTRETPPTFMAVTLDDAFRGVQAALMMAEFKKAGVPAEAHIYTSGGHGYGIRPSNNPVSTWHVRLQEWMNSRGLLEKPTAP
jgi:acetyl esterase/lipase